MRCPTLPLLALAALTLAACGEDATSPRQPLVDSAAVRPAVHTSTAVFPACTKHWKNGSNGQWGAAASWTPSGVPMATDIACLDAAGSYTVTLAKLDTVDAIVIGGGSATPTLRFVPAAAGTWRVPTGIDVRTGRLILNAAKTVTVSTGYVEVSGTLHWQAPSDLVLDSLVNYGTLRTDSGTVMLESLGPVGFRNSGDIEVNGLSHLSVQDIALVPGELRMEGGTVTGSGSLSFSGPWGVQGGTFAWAGGNVRSSGTTADAQTIQVSGADSGVLYLTRPSSIIGHLPTGAAIVATVRGTLQLHGVGSRPFVNDGYLTIAGEVGDSVEDTVSATAVMNTGVFALMGRPGMVLLADSLVNDSTTTVGDSATFGRAGMLVRNRGKLMAYGASLTTTYADFIAEAGSYHNGRLNMTGGRLIGVGSVGDVVLTGTQVQPGLPIGQLGLASLVMDGSSSVDIDVAGTAKGEYDQVFVSWGVTYAGTLSVTEIAPFVSAVCGQAIPIIRDHSSGPRGAFTKFLGLTPGPGRGWRLHNPADSLYLVGHNPLLAVTRAPDSLTVTEGGAGASYSVCLRSQPVTPVTVSASSPLGQLVPPAAVTFTSTDWGLPRTLTVGAVDDSVREPPPQLEDLQHTVTSTTPPYLNAPLGSITVTIVDNDGSANLELHVVSAPPVVAVGDSFTITLQNENLGPDDSPGATFTIPASTGFSYAANTGTLGCSYDAVTGTTCQLPSLVNGGKTDFTVTLVAVATGSYSTTYSLSSTQPDSNPLNNARVQLITVN